MKISAVPGGIIAKGIPSTGLSPDKIERIKAIAEGRPEAPQQEAELKPHDDMPRIKLKTDQSIYRELEAPSPQEASAQETPNQSSANNTPAEIGVSDTGVQAPAATEATQPLSPQMANLARQRRALQVKERELAEKEKALTDSLTLYKERIKSQPLSVLQEEGVTYDKLTQDILASQNNPDVLALKAEMKALKEGLDKQLADKDLQAEQAVLNQIHQNVKHIASQGDDYKLIRETGSAKDVVELIRRTWKQTGEVLDEREAMGLIEKELREDWSRLEKVMKPEGNPSVPEASAVTPKSPARPVMQTLTNKDQARPILDRKTRAILAMQGKLQR